MKIKIPLKPLSVNNAFQGRRYKTAKCKEYERDLFYLCPRKPMIKGKVVIHYLFYLKNHARIDYDNSLKILQDFLVKKGYIEDDRKIYKAVIEKIPAKEDWMEIEINPYLTN